VRFSSNNASPIYHFSISLIHPLFRFLFITLSHFFRIYPLSCCTLEPYPHCFSLQKLSCGKFWVQGWCYEEGGEFPHQKDCSFWLSKGHPQLVNLKNRLLPCFSFGRINICELWAPVLGILLTMVHKASNKFLKLLIFLLVLGCVNFYLATKQFWQSI